MKLHKDQIDKELDREEAIDWAVLIVGAAMFGTALLLTFGGAG